MSKNLELVSGMYAAFERGDVAAVLAAMDPQINWNEAENFPYSDGNPYIGPDAVVQGVFARLAGEWDYWKLAIEEILDAGGTVVARGRYQAKNKATGYELDAQFAHVWKIRDGKAIAFQQYADTAQAQRAVGG